MGKIELHLTIDAELAAKAEEAGVSLNDAAEEGIRAALAEDSSVSDPARGVEDRAAQWAEENVEAIKAHRERIEEFGVFGEDIRTW